MKKTIFYNTNPVSISTRLNEYMKSNFGYEIESDLESLREAKSALEAQKRSMSSDMQDRAYVENMLMLETVRALLKAHVAEGELPPALKAYQDKKKKKASDKEDKVEEKKKPDANGNGIPDYAEDGKGKNDLKKKKVKEGATKNAMMDDAEKMSKAAFVKKYGKENAETWTNMNESETPKFDTNTTKYDNSYEAPKEYKMKKEKLEEGLLAQLNALLEGDAAEAEITMAARGIVDELQDMIEKLGKIQNDQLGPLADEMAYSHGADQSASFKGSVDSAIAGLLDNARQTKEAVNNAVLTLTGQAPAADMGAGDMELGGDMAADMEDDITADVAGADDSMAGPVDEPLGRAKRAD
jgi:hypothetical protein